MFSATEEKVGRVFLKKKKNEKNDVMSDEELGCHTMPSCQKRWGGGREREGWAAHSSYPSVQQYKPETQEISFGQNLFRKE